MKLELEKLESRLKGRMQCEQDEVRRMFTVSPAAAAPPNEKHAKLGACHKPGSVFVGVCTVTVTIVVQFQLECQYEQMNVIRMVMHILCLAAEATHSVARRTRAAGCRRYRAALSHLLQYVLAECRLGSTRSPTLATGRLFAMNATEHCGEQKFATEH